MRCLDACQSLAAVAAVALAAACDGEAPANGAGSGGASSVTTATTATATTGSGTLSTPAFASLIREEGPGAAPAWVRLDNATPKVVTLEIGGASFLQLESGVEVSPQLGVSQAVAEDLRLGYCDVVSDRQPCIFLDNFLVTGPDSLEPGFAYTMTVTGQEAEDLAVEVAEPVVSEPYVGLRVLVDVVVALPKAQVMLLDLNEPLTFPALVDDPTEYQLAGGDDATITSVRLDHKGGSLAGALDVTFSGHGHTLVIASAPHPDALATVELSATE